MPPVVYLAHPYRGDAANLLRARRWYAWAIAAGAIVLAPWILDVEILGETPTTRAEGLRRAAEVIGRCDVVWLVGGEISPGMRREMDWARVFGIPVDDRTHLGPEPPESTP